MAQYRSFVEWQPGPDVERPRPGSRDLAEQRRRLELLDEFGPELTAPQRRKLLDRLVENSPSLPLARNVELCFWLEESNVGDDFAELCFALLDARPVGTLDALEIDPRRLDDAYPRLQLLRRAIEMRDWDRIEQRVGWFDGDYGVFAWDKVARSLNESGGCDAFIGAYAGGAIEPDSLTLLGREQLVALLAHCGETDWALELWRVLLPDLSDERLAVQKLDWHDELPALMWRELERRIAASGADLSRLYGQLLDSSWQLSAAQTVAWLEHWAASEAANPEPLLRASDVLAEAGNGVAAIDALERAVARRPEDPGLRLRLGVTALQLGDYPRVLAHVREVLEAMAASPRQRAEARYLRGRVARREGRWEEASGDLAHYFLLRMRYQGFAPDLGLLLLFHESGDRRGLEHYLAARSAAADEYRRGYVSGGAYPRLSEAEAALAPSVLGLLEGPLYATTIPYLERLAATRRADRAIARRLEQARSRASEQGMCQGPPSAIQLPPLGIFRPRPGRLYRWALEHRSALDHRGLPGPRHGVCALPSPEKAFDDAVIFADETRWYRSSGSTKCVMTTFARQVGGRSRGWQDTWGDPLAPFPGLEKNVPPSRYW